MELKSKGLKRIIWLTKFEIDFLNLKLAIDVIIFITILLWLKLQCVVGLVPQSFVS